MELLLHSAACYCIGCAAEKLAKRFKSWYHARRGANTNYQ